MKIFAGCQQGMLGAFEYLQVRVDLPRSAYRFRGSSILHASELVTIDYLGLLIVSLLKKKNCKNREWSIWFYGGTKEDSCLQHYRLGQLCSTFYTNYGMVNPMIGSSLPLSAASTTVPRATLPASSHSRIVRRLGRTPRFFYPPDESVRCDDDRHGKHLACQDQPLFEVTRRRSP